MSLDASQRFSSFCNHQIMQASAAGKRKNRKLHVFQSDPAGAAAPVGGDKPWTINELDATRRAGALPL
jgi:hypothetical protein